MVRIGLLGIGTFLPPLIRRNDWWPSDLVAQWTAARRDARPPTATTDGGRRVLAELAKHGVDPFGGVRERHVMPADMTAADMELAAAERAIAASGIARDAIDALLVHTPVPEYLMSNTACVLHDRLGLRRDVIALQLDASGYSFMMQLAIAEQMILSGRTRHALLVQSSAASRVLDPTDPYGPLLGDGAAAAVVGPVDRGGILGAAHRTDGRSPRALVASVPGRRWYDDGPIALHRADPSAAQQLFLTTADNAKQVVDAALAACEHRPADVDFFAVHQGTAWLRQVTQDAIGLDRARSIDTFATTGYMFGVSIPLVLELGVQQGLLHDGDLVVMHGGGVGSAYGAVVLRWQGGVS